MLYVSKYSVILGRKPCCVILQLLIRSHMSWLMSLLTEGEQRIFVMKVSRLRNKPEIIFSFASNNRLIWKLISRVHKLVPIKLD